MSVGHLEGSLPDARKYSGKWSTENVTLGLPSDFLVLNIFGSILSIFQIQDLQIYSRLQILQDLQDSQKNCSIPIYSIYYNSRVG